ncbi:MAG: RICIN domain-containing protein [Thaumarchaeota archaeon]|nr:RICIN domain-containing protein [Nitrososphaerota archaeon]
METIYPDEASAISLGGGFNTMLNQVCPPRVLKRAPKPEKKDLGQKVEYERYVSTTVEELRESVDVSASASVSGMWGSVSGRASFFESVGKRRSYTYLTVHTKVKNTEVAMEDEAPGMNDFKEEVKSYLKTKSSKEKFFSKYGNCYIHSYQTGGEFIAVMEFQTEDKESQKDIKAQLDVAASVWGQDIKASAEFKSSLQSASRSSTMRIKIYRNGGVGALPDVDALVETAQKFPDSVNPDKGGKPIVISANVNDYEQLFPLKYAERAPTLSRSVLTQWKKLSLMYNGLVPVENDLSFADKNLERFPSLGDHERVGALKKDLRSCRAEIEKSLQLIKDNPFGGSLPREELSELEDKVSSVTREVPTYSSTSELYNRPCKIKSRLNGFVLDINDRATENGTRVHMWSPYETDSQVWTFREDGTIENRHAKKVLDIPGSDTSSGVQLQIWTRTGKGTPNQRWEFAEGFISSRLSGKVLDVAGEERGEGAWVIMYDRKAGTAPNQQWDLDFL